MWLKTCMFSSNGFKKILQNVEVLRIKVFRVTKSLGRGQNKILGAVHKLHHRFLDHSRPLPSPLSSCVIFWHNPLPPTRWRNLWAGKWHIDDRLFCKVHPYCSWLFFILEQFLMLLRGKVWLSLLHFHG